ncbi:MAG: ornithine carbamoyltransferase [Bacilli bacterium]|nr:ornithine carbamoyltransferase [Bacilli bacterium]MDD4795302.1 ornithine carbamoyltransferase [Bacilli bacterium]
MNLKGRSFLTLLDYTKEEILYLINLSEKFKKLKKDGVVHKYLEGKNIVLLFEKASTRTRCSFEVAGNDLGMGVTFLDSASSQMGKKESIEDTAVVLGKLYDGIEYRGFDQELVAKLAEYSNVPVWNGLTDDYHPTQMIGDLLTIKEHFSYLENLNFVYIGDGRNNVANSLMIACSKVGLNYTCITPESLFPDAKLVETCRNIASEKSTITITSDPNKAEGANIIYTDVWVSMGEPEEVWDERIKLLKPYQVNANLMNMADPNCIFMHCLPSFHDTDTTIGKDIYDKYGIPAMEVTDEVFRSEKSLVFTEAENRMHTIKAIMYASLSDKNIL